MTVIHNLYCEMWTLIAVNSLINFISNIVISLDFEKKKFNDLNKKEISIISSVLISGLSLIVDLIVIIFFIKKIKIFIVILAIIVLYALILNFRNGKIKLILKANHLIFDILILLKPFFIYATIYFW